MTEKKNKEFGWDKLRCFKFLMPAHFGPSHFCSEEPPELQFRNLVRRRPDFWQFAKQFRNPCELSHRFSLRGEVCSFLSSLSWQTRPREKDLWSLNKMKGGGRLKYFESFANFRFFHDITQSQVAQKHSHSNCVRVKTFWRGFHACYFSCNARHFSKFKISICNEFFGKHRCR